MQVTLDRALGPAQLTGHLSDREVGVVVQQRGVAQRLRKALYRVEQTVIIGGEGRSGRRNPVVFELPSVVEREVVGYPVGVGQRISGLSPPRIQPGECFLGEVFTDVRRPHQARAVARDCRPMRGVEGDEGVVPFSAHTNKTASTAQRFESLSGDGTGGTGPMDELQKAGRGATWRSTGSGDQELRSPAPTSASSSSGSAGAASRDSSRSRRW